VCKWGSTSAQQQNSSARAREPTEKSGRRFPWSTTEYAKSVKFTQLRLRFSQLSPPPPRSRPTSRDFAGRTFAASKRLPKDGRKETADFSGFGERHDEEDEGSLPVVPISPPLSKHFLSISKQYRSVSMRIEAYRSG